jgi:hypothetical protein
MQPIDLREAARMKVHLRVLPLAGRTYRVVTLRPSSRARFSTNYYHDTWHIVSDTAGAHLLARLLWGLAYQKHPGTLVLLAEPHLVPTPFDGAPSYPVVLVPSGLTPFSDEALRQLKARLHRLGPTQTIRWHSFGLDRELVARDADETTELLEQSRLLGTPSFKALEHSERMSKVGGLICYTAPPLVLRQQAAFVARMRTASAGYSQMDYHYLADGPSAVNYADGEVQIFHDYRERVSAAGVARREVLAQPDAPVDPDDLETAISRRRDAVLRRRRR